MIELIALAIETDSTRAITLSSGFANGDFGLAGGYHGFSHHGEREKEVAAPKLIENNKMRQMAHLLDLLNSKPDPVNGGTLLDHTMVMFGCGMATGPHSTKNLPLLVAVVASNTGNPKSILKKSPKRIPASNLLLSMLQNFGVDNRPLRPQYWYSDRLRVEGMSLRTILSAIILGATASTLCSVSDPELNKLKPFLKQHCYQCHGPEKQKNDIRLDTLGTDLSDHNTLEIWQGVLDQLNLGENAT